MPSSKTYLIAGMHRSGTSLIASILQSSGIHVGESLLEGNQSNPYGHFEDLDFLNFHQSLLGENNKDGLKLEDVPAVDKNHLELSKLIISNRQHHDLWGWKDPRTTLFLDFWYEQLSRPFFILVYRHPAEVVLSLLNRGSDWEFIKNPRNAIAVWQHYNQKILDFKKANSDECLLCNLSGVTHDVQDFIQTVANRSGIKLDSTTVNSRFRPEKLNQYKWPTTLDDSSEGLLKECINLYAELEQYADIPSKEEHLHELNLPWNSFREILHNTPELYKTSASSVAYLLANVLDPKQTEKLFSTNDSVISSQLVELDKRKSLIAEQVDALDKLQAKATKFEEQCQASKKSLQTQQATIASYEDDRQISKAQIEKLKLELERQQEGLTEALSKNKSLSQTLSEKRRDLSTLNDLLSEQKLVNAKLHDKQQILEEEISDKILTIQTLKDEQQRLEQQRHQLALTLENEIDRQSERRANAERELVLTTLNFNRINQLGFSNLIQHVSLRLRQGFAILSLPFGGYTPHPLFDPKWYKSRSHFSRLVHRFPYVHYCIFGWREGRNPNPYFDVIWYLQQNLDVLYAGEDPLIHYTETGWREGRDPSPRFSTSRYLASHPELSGKNINPLIDYISKLDNYEDDSYRVEPEEKAKSKQAEKSNTEPTLSTQHVAKQNYQDEQHHSFNNLSVKVIAFYLPQFHPIPENDLFWGEGFTEWRNVSKAQPQFLGHDQPKLPGSLGFYDLRLPEVMRQQARLARRYGISGFCFHFYWFNGRRLLERPIEQLLANPDIDIEFCINWANENWTRSWDGKEKEVLIAQNHNAKDDLDFIREAKRFFDDPRYIRVDSKPVLIVYNPTLLPDGASTAKRWRKYCREQGFDLFLLVAETHGFDTQNADWFDGLVEFPPLRRLPEDKTQEYTHLTEFQGNIFNYADLADVHSADQPTSSPLFKTVSPGWDNTARRGNKATIFAGATPDSYRKWLTTSIEHTLVNNEESQRLLFVNAWNEWAEGAYLEPDAQNGYAYLNATAATLKQYDGSAPCLIFTTHDTNLGGAQNLLITLLRWLKNHTDLKIRIVASSGGVLQAQFESLYPTLILDQHDNQQQREKLLRFCGDNITLVFMNTVVSAALLPYLSSIKAPKILYAHELKNSIEKFYGDKKFKAAVHDYDAYIGGSQPVIKNLIDSYDVPVAATSVIESFIAVGDGVQDTSVQKEELRLALGLDPLVTLVLGCGMIEWRKGPDLFIEVARNTKAAGLGGVHFIWIGPTPTQLDDTESLLKGAEDIIEFLGEKTDFKPYFNAADIFLLPSREDPFPLVCLEAADSGLPIITFADNGGTPKFVRESNCGFVVPFEDTSAMFEKLRALVEDHDLTRKLGNNGIDAVRQSYSDYSAGPRILEKMREVSNLKPKVSIIVPTFNHCEYLVDRLDSIFNQTFQDFEVIIIDDASTDDTQAILSKYSQRPNTVHHVNKKNTGSPFKQWTRGIVMAKAEIIWIAEDDDFCELSFLEKLLPAFEDDQVHMVYCQSHAVDQYSERQFSYMDYYQQELDNSERWQASFTENSADEIEQGLALINTIPNASAVLFRKFDISEWESQWSSKKLAGDWAFYLHAMKGGKLVFNASHLNYHRRHSATMSEQTRSKIERFQEIASVHRELFNLYKVSEETKLQMKKRVEQIWIEVTGKSVNKEFDLAYDRIINPSH